MSAPAALPDVIPEEEIGAPVLASAAPVLAAVKEEVPDAPVPIGPLDAVVMEEVPPAAVKEEIFEAKLTFMSNPELEEHDDKHILTGYAQGHGKDNTTNLLIDPRVTVGPPKHSYFLPNISSTAGDLNIPSTSGGPNLGRRSIPFTYRVRVLNPYDLSHLRAVRGHRRQRAVENVRLALVRAHHGCNIVGALTSFAFQKTAALVILGASGDISRVDTTLSSNRAKQTIVALSGSFQLNGFWEPSLNIRTMDEEGLLLDGAVEGAIIAEGLVSIKIALFSDSDVVECYERI